MFDRVLITPANSSSLSSEKPVLVSSGVVMPIIPTLYL